MCLLPYVLPVLPGSGAGSGPGHAHCTIAPQLRRFRVGADGAGESEFTLTLAPDTAPQAYHMTAYAVQDLAVTTARRHFGVVPAT